MLSMRLLAGAALCATVVSLSAFAQDAKVEAKKETKKEAPKEAAKNTAIIPAPRAGGPMEMHKSFVEIAKKGDVDVLFLGDSITQGWRGKKAWSTFEKMKPANFGIGGDRTEHVLWRLTEGKELEGIKPKVVVLMIGTNNSGSNTAEQIAEGVKAIITEIHKQRPETKILLLGVFPRAGGIKKEETVAPKANLNPKIAAINAIISKYDDGKKVKYLDIGPKFLNAEGGLEKAVMPDLLHLSEKGYQIWADAIKDELATLLK